jgi:hypothetical protein
MAEKRRKDKSEGDSARPECSARSNLSDSVSESIVEDFEGESDVPDGEGDTSRDGESTLDSSRAPDSTPASDKLRDLEEGGGGTAEPDAAAALETRSSGSKVGFTESSKRA